jgi:hypothetical protein
LDCHHEEEEEERKMKIKSSTPSSMPDPLVVIE